MQSISYRLSTAVGSKLEQDGGEEPFVRQGAQRGRLECNSVKVDVSLNTNGLEFRHIDAQYQRIVRYTRTEAENPKLVLGSKCRDSSLHPKSQQFASFAASQSVKQQLGAFRDFPLFSASSIHETALRTGQWRRHLQ